MRRRGIWVLEKSKMDCFERVQRPTYNQPSLVETASRVQAAKAPTLDPPETNLTHQLNHFNRLIYILSTYIYTLSFKTNNLITPFPIGPAKSRTLRRGEGVKFLQILKQCYLSIKTSSILTASKQHFQNNTFLNQLLSLIVRIPGLLSQILDNSIYAIDLALLSVI